MTCRNYDRFMEAQIIALRRAIDENKWYLSEHEHHDVGMMDAQKDFIDKHCMSWASGFQLGFCSACKFNAECDSERKG